MIDLQTARLRLRVPQLSDLEAWAALDADPIATRFIGGVETRDGSRAGFDQVLRMWRDQGASLFSVLDASDGRWLGRVGPWLPKGALGTEIGWALAPSAQGKGYATEAARAVIDWAFATLDWSEVIHCITPGNTASVAVAERLGARWMRADIEVDGSPVDVFGQSRQAWLAQSNTGV